LNGPGPYLIDNNYLEGAGENVMFGGADPGIAGMVPRDITITRNHFYKPLVWKDIWTIKNSIEFKTAQYVLIEGNVFENNWPAAQEGVGIVFKANANGCECTYLGTRDVTFRYNIGKNMPVAWGLHAADDSYGWTGFVHFQRASFTHNLFTNIGAEGSRQSLLLATQDLQDIEIAHNTIVHAPTAAGIVMPMAYSFGAAHRLEIRDNVFTSMAGYAFHNSDNGTVHSPALNAFASDRTWVFLRNVVGGMLPDYVSQNPAGSFYPATVAGIGLNADYALSASSPYKGKGENGTDPGANIDEVNRRTAGVAAAASALAARRSGAPARPVRPRALTPREWEYIRRQPVSRDIKLP
jgi:hypothetical protein